MAGHVISPRNCLMEPIRAAHEVGLRMSFGETPISTLTDLDHVRGFPRNNETLTVVRESIDTAVNIQLTNPNLPFKSYFSLDIGKVLPSALKARGLTNEQVREVLEGPHIERSKSLLRRIRALRKYYLNPVADVLPRGVMGWTRSDIDSLMGEKFSAPFSAAAQPNIKMRFGRFPVRYPLDLVNFIAERKLERDGRALHVFHRSIETMLRVRALRDADFNDRHMTYTLDFRALTPSYIAVSHIDQREVDDFIDAMDLTCRLNFLTKTAALDIKDEPKGPEYPNVFPVPGSGYIR